MKSKNNLDLTTGSIFRKLIAFAIPILLTNFLQQLYHSADMMVVGNFARDPEHALASVGATTQVTGLLLNFFVSISIGANVVVAQARGAGDKKRQRRAITTSICFSSIVGTVLAVAGWILTPALLRIVNTPEEIMEQASLYMRIIFLGQPAIKLYNFCSAIFRAMGNAKFSMRILGVTGVANVVLNLFFVLVLHWDVAGVAIATVIAGYLSATAALVVLFHPEGDYRLNVKELRWYKREFVDMIRIGIPAALNTVLFSVSNVILSAAANALGKAVVASVAAVNNLSNLVHTVGTALVSALSSFSGQNYGAGKLRRTEESFWKAILLAECFLLAANLVITAFPGFFIGFFTKEAQVIRIGTPKLLLTCWGYMIYLFAEFSNSIKRGYGKTVTPTILNIACVCGVRVIWVWAVYPFLPQTVFWLYIALPISWLFSSTAQMIDFHYVRKRNWKKAYEEGRLHPDDAAYYEAKQKRKTA
ncbi:MAG: MATE family efflux transporter [Clostridia bacterium]|nr:MATE family efflux transporter [Clostridia bacterium]